MTWQKRLLHNTATDSRLGFFFVSLYGQSSSNCNLCARCIQKVCQWLTLFSNRRTTCRSFISTAKMLDWQPDSTPECDSFIDFSFRNWNWNITWWWITYRSFRHTVDDCYSGSKKSTHQFFCDIDKWDQDSFFQSIFFAVYPRWLQPKLGRHPEMVASTYKGKHAITELEPIPRCPHTHT